jgi:hypothetical protein
MSFIPRGGVTQEISASASSFPPGRPAVSKLAAALAWAARGYRVFKLEVNGKLPTDIAWTLHATTDPEVIKAWWTCPVMGVELDNNVGVLTTDIIVLDIDVKGGARGLETFEKLGLKLGDTLTVKTPTGGYHCYYQGIDREVGAGHLISNDDGLDIKSHNAYVLAPGSTIDGAPYVVEHDLPVAPFPEHLRDKLKSPRDYAAPVPDNFESDTAEDIAWAEHWLSHDAPPAVEGANGDDTTYRVACCLRDHGLSEQVAYELFIGHYNERCSPKWEPEAARAKITNAYAYATGEIGSKSLGVTTAAAFGDIVPVETLPHVAGAPGAGLGATAAPLFRSAQAFCAEYVPLSYVVEPIIRTASIYTVTAKTGAGKTAFATVLALAVPTGRRDILDMDVEQGRVAYLAFENPDDVRMRLMASSRFHGVDFADVGSNLIILDARHKPEDLVDQLRALTDGGKFSLVIVDTLAAAFDGQDVNDNVQTGEFVRRLRPITQLRGLPAVLICAHPVKNATDDQLVPYGGGAILNEVDGNLSLTKKGAGTTLHWQGKFRGLEFQPVPFRFEIVASPDVIDKKGRQVQLPVLVRSTEEALAQQAEAEGHQDVRLLQTILKFPGATTRAWAISSGVPHGSISRKLPALERAKLIEKNLNNQWVLTRTAKLKLKDLGCIV